jgi:hypothetical protein
MSIGDENNWINTKGFAKYWMDWLSFYFFGS